MTEQVCETLQVATVPDCSALGAAMAGMLGLGLCTSLKELAKLPRESTNYSPQMDADTVRRNVDGWQAALPRVF